MSEPARAAKPIAACVPNMATTGSDVDSSVIPAQTRNMPTPTRVIAAPKAINPTAPAVSAGPKKAAPAARAATATTRPAITAIANGPADAS